MSFAARVEVGRIVTGDLVDEADAAGRSVVAAADEVFAFAAEIMVDCADCGAAFGFRCQDVGLLPDRPAVSPDALELRVPLISPAELELLGPLAAMRTSPGGAGFRVRLG